jgi:PAS domain S-box-containing protein
MTGKKKENKDERIDQALNLLLKYSQMDFSARGPVSDKGDEMDAIMAGLNTLGEELGAAKLMHSPEEREITSAFFSYAPMGVIVIDEQGRVVYWNLKAEQIFGWKSGEVIGSYLHNTIIPPEYREAHKKGLKRFMQTGEGPVLNRPVELPARRKDNSQFDAGITISPANIGGRQLFVGFISDITYRRREVDENTSRLAAIVDSSDDAIVSMTLEGVIQTWNRSAHRIYGYTAAEVIGTHISIIVPPDLLNEEKLILENIRKGLKVEHFETVRLTRDGRRLNVALTVSPVRDRSGQVIGASKIARDITQKKEEEIEARKRTEYMENRVSELLDVLLRYTLLDFSVTARIGEEGDEFDAIAVGLNTMAEELQAEINRRKEFEEALLEKSKQLSSSNRDLENFAYVASHDPQFFLQQL